MQAGAGIGHQKFVLTQLQGHAATGDGVVQGEEDVFGGPGNEGLHGQGESVNNWAGQGHHEGHEEDGEPAGLKSGGAAPEENEGRQDENY